jgi:cation:H+ antiporter
MTFAFFALGLICLVIGAELLVRGASALAAARGIPPLVVGLTVVAFGTSAPELAVSFQAAWADQTAIAIGNVVGSNIFNVLFILGLAALIAPLAVSQQLIRLDVPLMIAVSVLTLVLASDSLLGRLDGVLLFVGIVAYTAALIRWGGSTSGDAEALPEQATAQSSTAVNAALVLAGLALLVQGSDWLVGAATTFAQSLGVSDLVIGLTVVAAGTSLPELVTSIVASLRGERDIAVGNIVGSNLFNLMGVLGLSAIVAPSGIPVSDAVLTFDLPIVIAVAVACLPVFFTGGTISRGEGALLLFYYIAYTAYLILAAGGHEAVGALGDAMFYFVLPLTFTTLAVLAINERRSRGA